MSAKDKKCNGCGRKGHFKTKCRSGMLGNNWLAQTSSFRRAPANTNTIVADGRQSNDPSKDHVFILGFLSQGNPDDSVTLNVGGIELHDFLIDSGAMCKVVDKSIWEWLKSKRIDANTRKSAKTPVLMIALILYLLWRRFQLMLLKEVLTNRVWLILLLLMLKVMMCWTETLLEIWVCCTLGR